MFPVFIRKTSMNQEIKKYKETLIDIFDKIENEEKSITEGVEIIAKSIIDNDIICKNN